ncbi:MAG: alpha/beta hydrolase-fold protein, partial [Candidatus Acidiferrales bacterium]
MKSHSAFFRFVANAMLFAGLIVLASGFAFSQTGKPTLHGTVERIMVHGKSLEGNLEGDSPDRYVSVYLPPSYKKQTHRRYPVVYLLHGYMDNDDNWFGAKHVFINAPAAIDAALSAGSREMIFVMPSAHTIYYRSMYSNSVTTGDWDNFIVHDLVSYIDAHYRT